MRLKNPSDAEKGKEGKKKCLRYKGDRVRMAGHHHSLPDLDHQITGTDIDKGTFFSQFCRFGYKTLLLIEFFG